MDYYPTWKKVAWRYLRIFLTAFLGYSDLIIEHVFSGEATSPDALEIVFRTAIIAGFAAVMKALRENVAYDSKIHKLPV